MQVCRSGAIGIVSPYIGVDYLLRIIGASESWRLVSDVEAWLSSLSIRARPKAWQFIRENLDRIHHCSAIHAKAVIGTKEAMLGSANLTITGMLNRTEMGILIDDIDMVAELSAWFNSLWQQTLPPIADEASAFIQWLDEDARRSPMHRDKFSLSASGTRIRARLAEIPVQATQEAKVEAIHLEAVAQVLVIQDRRHYESLGGAVEAGIDEMAGDGFTLRQMVNRVHQSFPEATIRETYFAVLGHCANHVRSVFSENTRNRLILVDGLFLQSTKESVLPALEVFDTFLAYLVRHFDFVQTRDLPDEEQIQVTTGVRGLDQIILVSELLDCGFLELEDIAGRQPQYNLSESFEWSDRYTLFARAQHAWKIKKDREPLADKSKHWNSRDVNQSFGASRDSFHRAEGGSLSEFLRAESAKEAVAERARKEQRAIDRQLRHDGVDKILAHLLSTLLSGQRLSATKATIDDLAAALGVKSKWVQQVLRGEELDIPKIVVISNGAISINPALDWKDLSNFTLAQRFCKTALGLN
ncbi:hypothetical protein RF819_09970 [Rhodoferax fermentans]|uniref:Phospholipase D-like domain-containing protein n=1 Tax=Rhodoferax fermentans TaxID=28066 RepID=A0A1T1ASQ8_RHOFE|nr:hypothetical protein RF819_09970 [Rhodoferax fermentans]